MFQRLILSLLFLTGIPAAACAENGNTDFPEPVVFQLIDATPQFGEPLQFSLSNLQPGQEIELRLKLTDARQQLWQNSLSTQADDAGEVNFHYDQDGVLDERAARFTWGLKGHERFYTDADATGELSAWSDDNQLTAIEFRWLSPASSSEIAIETVSSSLAARLYVPTTHSDERLSTIVVLGGSGGGYQHERASLLAAQGYAVLDLAYFGTEPLPDELQLIPLEYLQSAIDELETDPRLDLSSLVVMGKSRGAELALLWASMDARIKGVIAESPSSRVWSGSGMSGFFNSAWSFQGEPIAFQRGKALPALRWLSASVTGKKQIDQSAYMLSAFDKRDSHMAIIPVEQINGPILLISGDDDRLWPAARMGEEISTRLRESNFPFQFTHRVYENAGHNMGGGTGAYGVPYLPPRDRSESTFMRGGTVEGNSLASIDAWAKTLAFLRAMR